MDSRLLNAFHDDPFDDNYRKYNTEADFWSSEGETMGLAETLHGILPISATEDAAQLYNSALLKDDLHTDSAIESMQVCKTNKNLFCNDNYLEQDTVSKSNAIVRSTYDTDSDSDDDDNDDVLEMHDINNLAFDRQSESSQQTFRSRTDSSSIGDYESHSSDYDDETEDAPFPPAADVSDILNDIPNDLLAPDDFMILDHNFKYPLSKNRTLSTNTISSDVDGLGLHIDSNNFDLAEFITKDDFVASSLKSTPNCKQTTHAKHSNAIAGNQHKFADSDAESDIIVDVETVELEDEINVKQKLLASASRKIAPIDEDVLSYVDNVKRDPSWCPTATKKTEQCGKLSNVHAVPAATAINVASNSGYANTTRNYPIVPNKKQCDILKRKFGTGRGGKNLMAQRNAKLAAKKAQEQQQASNEKSKDAYNKNTGKGGMGGKNLSLLKQESCSISEQSSEEYNSPLKQVVPPQKVNVEAKLASPKTAVKRKLNLEEYKQRRSDNRENLSGNSAMSVTCKEAKLTNAATSNTTQTTQVRANSTTQPAKQMPSSNNSQASTAVKTIVENLKAQTAITNSKAKTAMDPITEAKNKVLRMQELKKAQQIKILDSTLSAKVPRVTKLLPLKEIVKDTYPVCDDDSIQNLKCHPDYEEIIIVSVSCNTDISLPPKQKFQYFSPRSLLKTSVKLNITTSSLIASIQNEVVKKTQESTNLQNNILQNGKSKQQLHSVHTNSEQQHGEDKIIMHLRKDRIRQRTFSIGTQTDITTEFPMLPFPKAVITHKSRERTRQAQQRREKRQYRRHNADGNVTENLSNSSFSSSDSDTSRSRSRSRTPEYCSSLEHQRSGDGNLANGGYSSRSSRRHRSSVSSSYSDTEHGLKKQGQRPKQRQRRYSYKKSKRIHATRSSSTSSLSDYTSRSRSRTRSRSPLHRASRSPSRSKRSNYNNNRNNYVDRNVSKPAVEERRIVYVGRIEQETTKEMLRRKFLAYGNIKQVTIHYKDTGMKYGFVTFERSQDAFNAIDNSTRDPQINMYDVSFGGRRAFCRATYADLDNAGINTYQSFVFPTVQPAASKNEDSFEALLLKVKAKLDANKTKIATTENNSSSCTNETNAKI